MMDIANDIAKVLDRQLVVVMYRNPFGTYTAAVLDDAAGNAAVESVMTQDDFANTHTDDFTPAKALHRLAEKMLATGEYRDWPRRT